MRLYFLRSKTTKTPILPPRPTVSDNDAELAPARAASKSQPSMFSSSINLLKRKAAAISVGSLIKDAVHGEFCKINSSFCFITEYFTN